MKKIGFLLFSMLLGIVMTQAQNLNLSGFVLDGTTGVANHDVYLSIYSAGMAYDDTTQTDTSGYFTFAPSLSPGATQGVIILYTMDCTGGYAMDSSFFNPGNTTQTFTLNYCSNSILCGNNFWYQCNPQNNVQFTSSAYGVNPITYSWDFGDGNTSTLANPNHTYASTGTYYACLITSDANGCSDTTCQNVIVAPVPNCTAQFYSFPNGQNNFGFIGDTTFNSPSATYSWTFGDGTSGSGVYTSHTYGSAGTYTVCLTVIDTSTACVDSFCSTVTVSSGGGNCQAGFYTSNQGNSVFFTNTSTGGTPFFPLSYQWDFGDGNSSTQQNPIHTYANAGTYTVCLIISGPQGCADTLCSTVTVNQGSGNCNAFFTSSATGSGSFSFTADTTGNSLGTDYFWDFGDGNTGYGISVNNTYSFTGIYTVCLTVIDSTTGCVAFFCDSVSATGSGNPNCQAAFSVFNFQGTTVQFINNSTGGSPVSPLAYQWDFGDGNTSTQASPFHSYANAGTYNVCLIVLNNSGCTDTTCTSVTVTAGPNCSALFFTSPTGTNSFNFYADTTFNGPGTTYSWSFGDGSGGSGMFTSHTYGGNGVYTVCLTVVDSANQCTDTYCDSVLVGNNPQPCVANFIYSTTAMGTHFTNLSTGGSIVNPLFYSWDFGDGNTSSAANPTHSYANAGTYTACLIVSDSLGNCSDTLCQVVTVQAPGTVNIFGFAFTDTSNFINDGIAYLILHDTIAGTLTAVDSVNIQQSTFAFYNVNPGTYLVKAALLPASPDYLNYLPTYFGDELLWNNATSVVATNTTITLPIIFLVQGNNPGGPGFVGGLISQGANKGPGDPMSNVLVMIMDENGNAVAYTYTNANGEYEFSNLAYGTYEIYVDIAGKYSDHWTVTISPDNQTFSNADFEVGTSQVLTVGTSLERFTFGEILGIYPNPARDLVQINVEFSQASELNIELVNTIGQVLDRQELGMVFGNQTFQIPVRELPQGTYLVKIQSNDQIITRRIIKQN